MDTPPLGRLLGSGKEAEIFECGALVVKLYRSPASKRASFREAGILALVESLGLPVPSVLGVQRFGERWGITMTRAAGVSFADAMAGDPGLVAAYLRAMAALHRHVHRHPGAQLANQKARVAAGIQQATILGEARRRSLLAGLAALPDGDRLCHGDFHPFNIVGPLGREVLLDWPNACQGDPAADVCRSYILIKSVAPAEASQYVDTYVEISGENPARIFSWLPFLAAARLSEDVADETDALLEMAASA